MTRRGQLSARDVNSRSSIRQSAGASDSRGRRRLERSGASRSRLAPWKVGSSATVSRRSISRANARSGRSTLTGAATATTHQSIDRPLSRSATTGRRRLAPWNRTSSGVASRTVTSTTARGGRPRLTSAGGTARTARSTGIRRARATSASATTATRGRTRLTSGTATAGAVARTSGTVLRRPIRTGVSAAGTATGTLSSVVPSARASVSVARHRHFDGHAYVGGRHHHRHRHRHRHFGYQHYSGYFGYPFFSFGFHFGSGYAHSGFYSYPYYVYSQYPYSWPYPYYRRGYHRYYYGYPYVYSYSYDPYDAYYVYAAYPFGGVYIAYPERRVEVVKEVVVEKKVQREIVRPADYDSDQDVVSVEDEPRTSEPNVALPEEVQEEPSAPEPIPNEVDASRADLSPTQGQLAAGLTSFQLGDYDEASEHFYAASIDAPEDRVAQLMLGVSLFSIGEYHYAAEYLRLSLDTWDAFLLHDFDIRSVYTNPADFEQHKQALLAARDVDPTRRDVLLVAAFVQFHSGDVGAGASLDTLADSATAAGAVDPIDAALIERYTAAMALRAGQAVAQTAIAGTEKRSLPDPGEDRFLAAPSVATIRELPTR